MSAFGLRAPRDGQRLPLRLVEEGSGSTASALAVEVWALGDSRSMNMSLAAKYSLLIGTVVAISTLGVAGFVVREASNVKSQDLLRHASELASIVGDHQRRAIYTGDSKSLGAALASLAESPAVAYARIVDRQGRVLASRAIHEGVSLPLPDPPRPNAAIAPRYAEFVDPERNLRYVDVLMPVRSVSKRGGGNLIAQLPAGAKLPDVLGFVQIGMDTRRLDEEIAALQQTSALFGVLLSVILGAMASLISKRLNVFRIPGQNFPIDFFGFCFVAGFFKFICVGQLFALRVQAP